MPAYYNEHDKFVAQWLRNLIAKDLIAPGEVDERDIRDVKPDDLRGFEQCHFFAGIGVWSYAARRAGWPDDRELWTGSCPCQPFSAAGKGGGFDDERHLWPAFHHLIRERRPRVVLGEQVASKDGLAWLDLVQADMEGTDYAFGAVDMCSAGFGAPHIRQRLYWMAYAADAGRIGRRPSETSDGRASPRLEPERLCDAGALDNATDSRCNDTRQHDGGPPLRSARSLEPGVDGRLADATIGGRREERSDAGRVVIGDRAQGIAAGLGTSGGDLRPSPTNGFWRDADWLLCRDGKWRPVEPGTSPLAHGAPARVGRLRAYGNAINAEQATEFCAAARDYFDLNVEN